MCRDKGITQEKDPQKYPPVLNWIYYTMDFVIKRIFPKFRITRRLYFLLTRGENRVMTGQRYLEAYSCGFEIKEEGIVNGKYLFLVSKIKEPASTVMHLIL